VGAFGSIALPQCFIWVTTPLLDFFELKNDLGVLLLGVLLLILELLLTDQGCLKGGRAGKFSVLPPNLSSATVGPVYDLGEDNTVMNMAVSKIAKYNNNGQYKELTMLVRTISLHPAPMIIQSNPVCHKFAESLCPSSSSVFLPKIWKYEGLGTACSLLLEYSLDRAGCHNLVTLQHAQVPSMHSLTKRVLIGSHCGNV
jgi:hypothetical protein